MSDLIDRQEDAVSRKDVVKFLDDWMSALDANCHHQSMADLKIIKNDFENLPSVTPKAEQQWIPCSERLPECEQEVLICTKKKIYIRKNSGFEWHDEPIITSALYEDGTMLEVNSKWRWEDIDYAGWDEEEDCGIIPE